MTCRILTLCLLVVLCGCASEPKTAAEQRYDDRKIEMEVLGQDFVRATLKWPHDASFNWDTQSRMKLQGDMEVWTISGLVTAKNAFGAELTQPYEVLIDATLARRDPCSVKLGDTLVFLDEEVLARMELAVADEVNAAP